MNFQQLMGNDILVQSDFEAFCARSKPYDFCMIKNPSARMTQIKKYYDYLRKTSNIFYLLRDGGIRFFIAIRPESQNIIVEFVFGSPSTVIADFEAFRSFYWSSFDCGSPFTTEIQRQHKLKEFLNFIKKRDKKAQISLDGDKILLLYSKDGL